MTAEELRAAAEPLLGEMSASLDGVLDAVINDDTEGLNRHSDRLAALATDLRTLVQLR